MTAKGGKSEMGILASWRKKKISKKQQIFWDQGLSAPIDGAGNYWPCHRCAEKDGLSIPEVVLGGKS